MPQNICVELFTDLDDDLSVRATATVVGKTFADLSADIQSGPDITTTDLPVAYDGGNFQGATAAAGVKPIGVWAFDGVAGQLLPVKAPGKIVPVTAGAAITAGQEVEVGASGRAIPLATGKPAGKAFTAQPTVGSDVYIRIYA